MKNKKGFTLIELLAVIIILLIISIIAISSIKSAMERNKIKQNIAKTEVIVSYAKLYYNDHKNTLGTSGIITMDQIKELASEEELKDAYGEPFDGYVNYTNGDNFTYIYK